MFYNDPYAGVRPFFDSEEEFIAFGFSSVDIHQNTETERSLLHLVLFFMVY